MKSNWKILLKLISSLTIFISLSAGAYERNRLYSAEQVPEELKGLEVKEKLGAFIDLNLPFINDKGATVLLGEYFKENKPVLMSIVYYGCPNLCGLHLNGLSAAVEKLPESFQDQFESVIVSMDSSEGPKLAAEKKKAYMEKYALIPDKWHFLTGRADKISSLSEQLGFRFRWDDNQKIFAHFPVAYVLTPEGQISRYLYGVEYLPQTLRLSLVEAGQKQVGSIMDRILLFCFQFDPNKGRYSWYAYNIMRTGGVLTLCLLFGFLLPVWIRERNRSMKGS